MGAFPFVAPPVGLSAQSAACLPSGLRRQPLLSLPGPGKRCTASFSPRGFESNLIGYNQTAAPPLWVALLFGSPCWTRTNDTPQFAIVALRRRERLPGARCSLGFRLAPPRTAGARLRPVNSRDPADAQSRWARGNQPATQKERHPHGCLSFCGSPCWTLRSIRGLLALRAAQATAPFAPRPRKTMHCIVFASGLRVQPHRVQPNSSATPLGGAAVWLPLLDSNQRHCG